MSTGQVESWSGTMSEIGPLYPFVGSEMFWFVLALALWILWHVLQSAIEKRAHREEVERYGDHESLRRLVERQSPEQDVSD